MSRNPRRPRSLRVAVATSLAIVFVVPVAAVALWTAFVTPQFSSAAFVAPVVALLGTYGVFAVGASVVLGRLAVAPLARLVREIDGLDSSAVTSSSEEPIEIRDVRLSVRRRVSQSEIAARQTRETAAMILHDLKAPVLGVRNVLRLIRTDVDSGARLDAQLLSRLGREMEELAAQVAAGVNVLRVLGEAELGPLSRVDVRVLVDEAVLRAARTEISTSVSGHAIVVCDPQLMSRALFNLIENAVRYARSTVFIELHPGLVRVGDDGPGLPSSLAELVHPFRSGGSTAQSGLGGLGLAMAKRALDAHGGSLQIERSDSRGTVLLAYLGHQFERLDNRE